MNENQNIKQIELKHLDIQNKNLLKKVLTDCNYSNEKKAAMLRAKEAVSIGGYYDASSFMNSLIDGSSSGHGLGVRNSNTEMRNVINNRKLNKSPSGITLENHSILIR